MTLSSLWSAKCSGLSEGERGKTSPAGELQSSSHNANLIAPYASEKIAYELQITCTVRTVYGNLKYKRCNVLIFFNLPYRCVQVQTVQVVRTSSVKKCTFYGQGWTSGSMPTKPRTLRPPGRAMLCTAPESLAWELWCFFVSCLNIRKILQERRKNGKTATEKEKSPYWLQGCNSKGGEVTVY